MTTITLTWKKLREKERLEESENREVLWECIQGRPGSPTHRLGTILFKPYIWQLSNKFFWHDEAMLFEQYHWERALKKGQPYKFKLNQYMDKDHRDAYHINWAIYSTWLFIWMF
jgi:hypothetical protein